MNPTTSGSGARALDAGAAAPATPQAAAEGTVRLRLLFGTVAPEMPGGIPATEAPFHRRLRESGAAEVAVLPFGRRRPRETLLERIVTRFGDLARYAAAVRRLRPDVVHLDTAFDRRALTRDLGYVLLSRLLGQPLFLKMHGSQDDVLRDRSPLWRALTRFVLGGASGVGVLSSEEKDHFVRAGFAAARFHVLPNTVDVTRFSAATWPRPGPPQLLFIARMIESKGLADVIEAMRRLRDAGRDVALRCVGDGPARAGAEALVRSAGLGDRVRFTGQISETEATRHYLESTLLVFPTWHREGFSMTIFQSLAAGLPIVTTRIRAAADHLREPDHCLWVPPRDPEALAARVAWLLDRPDVMAAMSRANRELAKRFAPGPVAGEYLEIYRRIGRSARRPGAGA